MALNKETSDIESEAGKADPVQETGGNGDTVQVVQGEKGTDTSAVAVVDADANAERKEPKNWAESIAKANAATEARQKDRTQKDKEQAEKFNQDQARAVKETAEQFQQESKEEESKAKAKAERIRDFDQQQEQLKKEALLKFEQEEQALLDR